MDDPDMSNCGNCRNKRCSCSLVGDNSTTKVRGLGAAYEPYQVRKFTPAFRYVGEAHRTTSVTFTPQNVDLVVTFQATNLPITAGNMWNIAQPTRLTAAVDGLYLMGGYAGILQTTFGVVWDVWIAKNGVSTTPLVRRTTTHPTSTSFANWNSVMTLSRLTAGDYIELWVRTNHVQTTPNSPIDGAKPDPYFWAQWMGA